MTNNIIGTYAEKVIAGSKLTRKEIDRLAGSDKPEEIMALIFWADRVRRHFKGDEIDLCAIVNAKSGRCSEDCRFCAQSSHHPTRIPRYPLLAEEALLAAAERAGASGAGRFSLVTSGRSLLKAGELDRICRVISTLRDQKKLSPCASLGLLTAAQARALREAGLVRYTIIWKRGRIFTALFAAPTPSPTGSGPWKSPGIRASASVRGEFSVSERPCRTGSIWPWS